MELKRTENQESSMLTKTFQLLSVSWLPKNYCKSVSMGWTVSPQKAKKLTVNRQSWGEFLSSGRQLKTQLLLAVKPFQGFSNFTISAAHLGLLASKE